ncbi:uncharacterized protein LOC110440744, partial [Mizuhopecten yessoensis]
MVFVSDDIQHDAHFVEACLTETLKHLEETVLIRKIVQFTDGCSSQYKSKIPFLDISARNGMDRNFFGSGHGKGPADAVSGVVKSAVTRAVKGGQFITNAKQLKEFGDQKLARDQPKLKRTFHLLDNIKRDRNREGKTVKGTRKLHSVRGISYGKIGTRALTCTCVNCLGLDGQFTCPSSSYVSDWVVEDVCVVARTKRQKSTKNTKEQGNEKENEAPATKRQKPARGIGRQSTRGRSECESNNNVEPYMIL